MRGDLKGYGALSTTYQDLRFEQSPGGLSMRRLFILTLSVFFFISLSAEDTIRIASYNIQWFTDNTTPERETRLKKVIADLGADVIALQEINDKAALRQVFPEQEWMLMIDDTSGDRQDLALAVSKRLKLNNGSADIQAEDEHFLFPLPGDRYAFPKRRDVLYATITTPEGFEFVIMNVHLLSRTQGRHATNPRRVAAAKKLLQKIEADFDDQHVIILGDWNDTADDQALNILETGNPNARARREEEKGEFLVNLTEPLWAEDMVTHGAKYKNGSIQLVKVGARKKNWDNRNNDTNTGSILFDQLLVSQSLYQHYYQDSMGIFAIPEAIVGTSSKMNGTQGTRASDHLPVYADFIISGGDGSDSLADQTVIISALLPNPDGSDMGNEKIKIKNMSDQSIVLNNYLLRDRAGNDFTLNGSLDAHQERIFTIPDRSMPLNNGGDDVYLFNNGNQIDYFSYDASEVKSGYWINR